MKKLIALMLTAAMLLCSCAALADTTKTVLSYDEGMDITMLVPEGYTLTSNVTEQGVMNIDLIGGENTLNACILVAADADVDDAIRFNDLSDEEKQAFAADLIEDTDATEWTIMVSGHGTEAVVVDLKEAAYDSAMISSVYYGYGIVMYVAYMDGRELTQADLDQAMQFFTDLNFEAKYAQ